MLNLYDILYAAGVGLSAPVWGARAAARRKVLRALAERMGEVPRRTGDEPAVMIHAVSMGEINATRALVRALGERRPELRFIVSTTTDTGFEQAGKLYGADPRVRLIRFPLDFSAAVRRVLELLRPAVVVLMELEVWPNFMHQCGRLRVPVVLVNGRVTPGSYRNYRLGRSVVGGMFRALAKVCVQEEVYAERFVALGARPERVSVTGTMKFDTATVAERVAGDEELAAAVGLSGGPVWVCGSTGPGEEELVLGAYRRLLEKHPALRLVIVPRHPQRFDEVAELIRREGYEAVRRSERRVQGSGFGVQETGSVRSVVVLGDTMGELRKFYSLATVVFVGRSLVDLGARQHGSDMIEPAALGKPVIVGRYTANFAEVMNRFRDASAVREVDDADSLCEAVDFLLSYEQEAYGMGRRAQQVVKREQGATERHVEVILGQWEKRRR